MNTLTMMVTGIVPSKQSHLEAMAPPVPDGSKISRREKKFARFAHNEPIHEETYFMPFLTALLRMLTSLSPLRLIFTTVHFLIGCSKLERNV